MKRFTGKEIPTEIKNGNPDVLAYLCKEYFASSRRLMRIRGVRDTETPKVFSAVLASVILSFLKRRTITGVDFETSFFNELSEYIKDKNSAGKTASPNVQIASQCVSIMDEQSQKLLFARVVEKMSYENIAERFQYSNAVIAQYEVHKALNQLEGIVKLRMNISQN